MMSRLHDRAPTDTAPAILVVDDDPMMQQLIRRTLTLAGHEVWTAASVAEARQLLPTLEDRLDLVLADVVMPGGLGPDLAPNLLIVRPQTRVAYMSSYPLDKLRAHGVDLDGAPLLVKPFLPAELLAFLTTLIPARRTPSSAS